MFRRDTIGSDAVSGVVLGVESVPDSLASGLLAGVNPVFGLYGAMWGTFTGALFTSSAFMAVQTTGAPDWQVPAWRLSPVKICWITIA